MLALYTSISFVLATCYVVFILYILKYWYQDKSPQQLRDKYTSHKFSFIIPVRNEADQIQECLNSILKNEELETHVCEILVLDDYSTDETKTLVQGISHPLIQLIELKDHVGSAIEGSKKRAIDLGVSLAQGDYIIQTDGDCLIGPSYVRTLAKLLNTYQISLIGAPVVFAPSNTLLEHFQTLDLSGMMALTKAGIMSKKWYLANGANLIYKKDLSRDLDKSFASGDDISRIGQYAKLENQEIYFSNENALCVTTPPENTLKSFIAQRIRWGTKNQHSNNPTLLCAMALVFIQSLWFYVHVFAIILIGIPAIFIACTHLFLKLSVDYLLLETSTKHYDSRNSMRYIIPAFIIQQFYISMIGLASLVVKKYNWKGRVVK